MTTMQFFATALGVIVAGALIYLLIRSVGWGMREFATRFRPRLVRRELRLFDDVMRSYNATRGPLTPFMIREALDADEFQRRLLADSAYAREYAHLKVQYDEARARVNAHLTGLSDAKTGLLAEAFCESITAQNRATTPEFVRRYLEEYVDRIRKGERRGRDLRFDMACAFGTLPMGHGRMVPCRPDLLLPPDGTAAEP